MDAPNPKKRISTPTPNCDTAPCWREILQNALDGFYPSDQRLEGIMDRYERVS